MYVEGASNADVAIRRPIPKYFQIRIVKYMKSFAPEITRNVFNVSPDITFQFFRMRFSIKNIMEILAERKNIQLRFK